MSKLSLDQSDFTLTPSEDISPHSRLSTLTSSPSIEVYDALDLDTLVLNINFENKSRYSRELKEKGVILSSAKECGKVDEERLKEVDELLYYCVFKVSFLFILALLFLYLS